jgi:nucleotide-binding universal stress UspA family protein
LTQQATGRRTPSPLAARASERSTALRWASGPPHAPQGAPAPCRECTIDAVIAWEFPVVAGSFGWPSTAPFDDTDYRELAAKALNAAVAEVSPPPGVTVHQIVTEGNAAQVLLDAAKDADPLVVGNRGHGGFADALIGSVSVCCLHHATCPVVNVRTPRHSAQR